MRGTAPPIPAAMTTPLIIAATYIVATTRGTTSR